MKNKLLKSLLAAAALYFASAVTAQTLLVPSGALGGSDKILKYDLATGNYLGDFASATDNFGADNGKGVLQNPTDIAVGPDGKVYVTYTEQWDTGNKGGVVRFLADGTYDGLIVDFDSSNPGTPVRSTTSVTFGSDGLMYVGHQHGVKQYTTNGVFQDDVYINPVNNSTIGRDVMALGDKIYFNSPLSAGWGNERIGYYDLVLDSVTTTAMDPVGFPQGMASDSVNDRLFLLGSLDAGNLNVALWDTPTTGTIDPTFSTFASSGGTLGMLFFNDKLYLHEGGNGNIRILDAATGADEGLLVSGDPNLTATAWGMAVIPEPSTLALLLLFVPAVLVTRSVRVKGKR